MKRIILSLSMLIVVFSLSAQSVLSFGPRGGLEFMLPKSDQTTHSKLGFAGVFDIGYTYYWPTVSGDWGIHTGVSAGYAKNECQIELWQQFTNYDYLNNEMLYTVTGDVSATLQRAYAEIPLMAALQKNGFVLQLGLKGQYAFWSRATQTVKNASIDAYYVPFDVHVTDELITGVLSPDQKKEQVLSGGAPLFSLLAAMRIGYEAKVGYSGRIGIVAYLDYNVWNTGTGTNKSTTPLIAVAPITDPSYPVPAVTVNNSFSTVMTRINPLQVGLSLYYAIEFKSKKHNAEDIEDSFTGQELK